MDFRKVLIAVDDDPVAAHAAEVGLDLGRSLRAEVAIVHVIDTTQAYGADTGIAPAKLAAQVEAEAKGLMAGYLKRLSLPAGASTFLAVGLPAEEIVKAADEWAADLIVIGSHGRGGVRRVLVGSVAEGVMRHASCPVLVVRGKS